MAYSQDNISLLLAQRLSDRVNAAWNSGEMLEKVTPVTRELLQYWFCEPFTTERNINYHLGQRQAILNTIYLHEVVGVQSVADSYTHTIADELEHADMADLAQEKYQLPKYAIKMATGTGKTWVMHALVLWQMLNARHTCTDRYTQKFLLIAPGLIVYDRLMDAYLGKIENGVRHVEMSDLHRFQALFIPPQYREEVFNFVHINTVGKEQGIGRKAAGDGLIAITNWHLFLSKDDEVEELDPDYKNMQDILLPSRPGVAAGNALDTLDRRYLRGSETEFLQGLPDLMIINDEAHHVHENGQNKDDVQWQQAIDYVMEGKRCRVQVDFSATPYEQRGSGRRERKIYFPHVIVDFGLKDAMQHGLVKTLSLDQRQNLTELEDLDFNAVYEGKKAIALSDGQKLMLRAGLERLNHLQAGFSKFAKMMVVCENTYVTPLVENYLLTQGLQPDEVLRVDSDAKGKVKDDEWKRVKERLSSMDSHATPRVVVSVMMLREGFDVNNICVIVPLRSMERTILLEQVVGRGLRLMWREPEFLEAKAENRHRLLVEKREPLNHIDMLFIVEHPRFREFYNELLNSNLMAVDTDLESTKTMGDMITARLKEEYERYDIAWLNILRESEEVLEIPDIDVNRMEIFEFFTLNQLKKSQASGGETFVSKSVEAGTSFGKFNVKGDLFTAESYREYLQKLLGTVTRSQSKDTMPLLQVGGAMLMGTLDNYIRTRLFGQEFNPFEDNNWKILLSKNGIVTKHIVEQMLRVLGEIQQQVQTTDANIEHIMFSSVPQLDMRERLSQEFVKTIYNRTAFASQGGGLERAFMEFLDNDGEVERWIKISEHRHQFARIAYMREDCQLAHYIPDFIVQVGEYFYLIETKADNQLLTQNVQRKRRAAVDWCQKVSQASGQRWEYIIVGEGLFYSLTNNGATFVDLCEQCRCSSAMAQGLLSF